MDTDTYEQQNEQFFKVQKEHMQRLNSFCRLCDMYIKRSYQKNDFSEEIFKIFDINVLNEAKEVYPSCICNVCARALYRYRQSDGQSLSTCQKLKSIQLKIYSPHTENCSVCLARNPTGRPKKRERTQEAKDDETHTALFIDQSEKNGNDTPYPSQSRRNADMTQIYALLNHMQTVFSNVTKDHLEIFFTKLLDSLTVEILSILCKCLGRKQRKNITKDSDSFSLLYKDLKAMSNFDILQWLMKRDDGVTSYLLGLGGLETLKTLEDRNKEVLPVSRALEHLYSLCSRTLVSPVSFLLGLTTYAITGSRTAVDILGNTNPSGHYKTITNWLKDQGSEPSILPPEDLMNVFDNEQVVGKTYSIRPKNKVSVSVITNKGFVALQSEKTLQQDADLKPVRVLYVATSREKHNQKLKTVLNDMIDQENEIYVKMEMEHNQQLYHFINHAIDVVMTEQKFKDGKFEDEIDEQVKTDITEQNYIKCFSCGTLNIKRKIVCTGCEGREGLKKAKEAKKSAKPSEKKTEKLQRLSFLCNDENTGMTEVQYDTTELPQFSHVPTNHTRKHELVLTDPVFCNPNSLVTVARVLRKIGKENDIVKYGGKRRYWTFVCCDGLPYIIIKKLKEEAVVCAIPGCEESFISKIQFEKHASQDHEGLPKQYVFEFDWFYIRIGAGHYEMNLVKSFFELNWIPCLESLCEQMGYESESSKQYAKSCKDHHKSWRLLLIFHLGTLQELVLPYVRNCMTFKVSPTAKGFLAFSSDKYKSNSYPNFTYMMDQVCRFSQGIVNFRMATRRNNAALIKSAKYMTKEVFHGRSHPKYQIIEIYDSLQDLMMPEEVRELNDRYTSITTSENFSAGEDFDFILEEKNKQLKAWIPKGMPTDIIWQTVCRNNKALEAIKEHSLGLFGITPNRGTARPLGIEEAIPAYRTILRRSGYFEKVKDHVSLSGMALDDGLAKFVAESTLKRIHLLKSEFLGETYQVDDVSLRNPVPITPSEREKNESTGNMTKKQIQAEISKLLDKISDPFQFDYHINLYQQEVKMKGKARLVHFLQELKSVLDNLRTDSSIDDVKIDTEES